MKNILSIVLTLFFLDSCTQKHNERDTFNNQLTFNEVIKESPVFKTIYERRSVRVFKNKEVDDNTIRLLVEAAQWAPSPVNVQTWRFIAVRDSVKRNEIAHTVHVRFNENRDTPVAYDDLKKYLGVDAPVQIFVFNDTRESKDPEGDAIGCYAAVQNFILAAQSIGLSTCWQGFPVMAKDVVNRLFEVPEGFELVASIALGYANEQPERKERKYELNEILSFEKWN